MMSAPTPSYPAASRGVIQSELLVAGSAAFIRRSPRLTVECERECIYRATHSVGVERCSWKGSGGVDPRECDVAVGHNGLQSLMDGGRGLI